MRTVELRALVGTVVNNVFNQAVPVRAGELFFTQAAYGANLVADHIAEYVTRTEVGAAIEEAVEEEPIEEAVEESESEFSFESWLSESCSLPQKTIYSLQISGVESLDELADRLEADLSSLLAVKGIGPATVKKLAEELGKLGEKEQNNVEES